MPWIKSEKEMKHQYNFIEWDTHHPGLAEDLVLFVSLEGANIKIRSIPNLLLSLEATVALLSHSSKEESYLQKENRDTDIENKQCVDTEGGMGGRWDELGGWEWHMYTVDTIYKVDN